MDFAFIDGHHDEDATLSYFHQVLSSLSEHSVLVFDDIRWSAGMAGAWRAIVAHEHVELSLDLGKVGLCVLSKGSPARRQSFYIPLD